MKKFIFIYTGANNKPCRIEQTETELLTNRFPKQKKIGEHEDIQAFCEKAKVGDYIETIWNIIFCTESN